MRRLLVALTLAAACCPTPPPTKTPEPAPTASAPPVEPEAPKLTGPPLARRDDVQDVIHGVTVLDPYRWLEDPETDETKAWLAGLDGYSRKHLDGLPGRDALEKRITELSYLEWVSPPLRRGNRYFFSRRHKDKEKSIYYWREGADGEPKVLIDPNQLSDDGSTSLKGAWPSYDGKWVAYKLSENNADEATMHVMRRGRRVRTARGRPSSRVPSTPTASWEPNGQRLLLHPGCPSTTPSPSTNARATPRRATTGSETDPSDGSPWCSRKTGDPADLPRRRALARWPLPVRLTKYYGWTSNEVDVSFKDLQATTRSFGRFAVGYDAKFEV